MSLTFDTHTHVGMDGAFWSAGWWPYASTVQDQLQHMDATGIDRAVCFPFCTPTAFDYDQFKADRSLVLRDGRFPFDVENALMLQEIERLDRDRRLLPFGMFDPGRCIAEQYESLKGIAGGLFGLKTQATVLQSKVSNLLGDAKCFMELAEEYDLPVVIHTSIIEADIWSQVQDCLDVAAAYPKVRFNLAHSLRFDEPGLREAATRDNVWVDCSAHLVHCELAAQNSPVTALPERRVNANYDDPSSVLRSVYEIMGSRYMWGSDNPFMSWCDDGIRAVHTYTREVDVMRDAGDEIAKSMLTDAPLAWLGSKGK